MNKHIETTVGILAALFVLLSAMFDVRMTKEEKELRCIQACTFSKDPAWLS